MTSRMFLEKLFSFADLLYLAAEIDKHGLQNVFLPMFLPFPLYSEFSLSFPSSLPPFLPLSLPFLCQAIFQIHIKDTSSVGIW